MAVYDLTQEIPSKFKKGDILNCPYSGAAVSITLPKGVYQLEVWGASGGAGQGSSPVGRGGYSIGTLTMQEPIDIFLYAGGAGKNAGGTTSRVAGGFNGGGNTTYYGGTGGGGSDIRLGQDSLYARVIVAGGGGGCGGYSSYTGMNGGHGGGTSGTYGGYQNSQEYTAYGGRPATQTAGGSAYETSYGGSSGSFGQGGNGNYYSATYRGCGGSGGGWYGGGAGYRRYTGGGGGSGYVYTSATKSSYPSGCLLNESMFLSDASTIDGKTAFPKPTDGTETGHTGDGYCRITIIDVAGIGGFVQLKNQIIPLSSGFVCIDAKWHPISNIWYCIDNAWVSGSDKIPIT